MFKSISEDLYWPETSKKSLTIDGTGSLSILDITSFAYSDLKVDFHLSPSKLEIFNKTYEAMAKQVRAGVPIYGTTASYGGRAGVLVTEGEAEERFSKAKKLSEAIVHVDVSTGDPIPREITRAAMLIRLNMISFGYSGIRNIILDKLAEILNAGIVPIVGRYGTLGASGDLALNGRVLSCLLGDVNCKVWDNDGSILSARDCLEKHTITPLDLGPKEGLALVNGDNFSSAAAVLLFDEVFKLFILNLAVSSIFVQVMKGSARNYHPILHIVRPHPGQKFVSMFLMDLIKGGKLIRDETTEFESRIEGELVQDPYSIRCLPQYYGPDFENLLKVYETIKININSLSDNPIWITPEFISENEKPYNWISGGNFLAMHMAETLDSLRKTMARMVRQNDRLLARLVDPKTNLGLPANLSDKGSISQAVFKGLQTQMGMFEVYSLMLSESVTTKFGIHEEGNQDLTSHAFTSAIISWELLKILKYAIATNLMALSQAIDFRGGKEMLSPLTKDLYDWTRKTVPFIQHSQPLGHYLEDLVNNFSFYSFSKYLFNENK